MSYLSKETFAKRGYILRYDEEQKKPIVISYLGNDSNYKINNNILRLADRSKKGFYINSNTYETDNLRYKKFLTEDIKGIICVPIVVSKEYDAGENRRQLPSEESEKLGYIYLETDRVFNRFDIERLNMVRNLLYLAYVNLENYNLKSSKNVSWLFFICLGDI